MAGFKEELVTERVALVEQLTEQTYMGNIGFGCEAATGQDLLILQAPPALVTAIGPEKIRMRAHLYQDPNLPMLPLLDVREMADGLLLIYRLPEGARPLLDAVRELSLTHVIEVFINLCEVLSLLHERVLWHGGLVPGSVWLLPDGAICLLPMLTDSAIELYNAGGGQELLDFFAPETMKRNPLDARTDIYSLGVLFYFACTGKMPRRLEDGTISPPSEYRPHIPQQLDRLVLKMLNLSPSKRFHWIGQVKEELGRLIGLTAHDAYPDSDQVSSRHLFTAEFIGREQEVARVNELYNRMINGMGGALMCVGRPGVGRRRIVYEVLGHHFNEISLVSCRVVDQRFGYAEELAKRFLTLSFLQPELESIGLSYLGRLGRALPSIAEAFRERFVTVQDQGESPMMLDALLYEFFVQVLKAHDTPMLLVLLDGHLLDKESLGLIKRLRFHEELTVALVAVADQEEERLASLFDEVLHVEALPVEEMRACLLSRLGSADFLDDEFILWLNHHTQGSLTQSFALLEYLVDSQQIVLQRGVWSMQQASVNQLQIPESMDAVMLSRINSLPPLAQEVCRLMAMFKGAPSLIAIAKYLQLKSAQMLEIQYLLQELRMIIQTIHRYQFASNRVKEAIYRMIPEAERRERHSRLSDCLREANVHDDGEIAYQLELGERYELAICLNLSDAKRASRQFEYEVAEAKLQKAIDLYKKLPGRRCPSSFFARLAETQKLAGKLTAAAELYLQIFHETGRLSHLICAMMIHLYTGNYRAIAPYCPYMHTQSLKPTIRLKEQINLLTLLGLYRLQQEPAAEAILDIDQFHHQQSQELRRELRDRDYLTWMYHMQELLQHVPCLTQEHRAQYLQEAATLAEHNGCKRQLVPIYRSMGRNVLLQNMWRAKEHFLLALKQARDYGDLPNQALLCLHLANTYRLMGDLELVRRFLEQARELGISIFGSDEPLYFQQMAELALFLEDYDKAEEAIWRLQHAAKLRGAHKLRRQAFLYRFQSVVEQGRERQADRLWPTVQRLCRVHNWTQEERLLGAKYLLLKGNLYEVAHIHVMPLAEEASVELSVRLELTRMEALLRMGRHAEGLAAAQELQKRIRQSGCYAYLAWVYLLLGRLHRSARQFVPATLHFRRSMLWFRQLNHQPRLHEIEYLLRAEDQEMIGKAVEVFHREGEREQIPPEDTAALTQWVRQVVEEKEELVESLNEHEMLLESLRRINVSILMKEVCVNLATIIFEKVMIDRLHVYVHMGEHRTVRLQWDEQIQEVTIEHPEVEEEVRLTRETGRGRETVGRDAYLYSLPIYSYDQLVIATLVLEKWTVQSPVSEQDRRFLHNLAGLVSSNIENAIMYEAMITDNLTGLYTRNFFMKRLYEEFGKVQRYGIDLSFLMIDLDNFSAINNKYGHHEGDRVLRDVATKLKQSVRPVDIVGRFGGEELIVILPNTSGASAQKVAARILHNLRTIETDGTYVITASIGVSSCDHDHPSDADDLFEKADQAETYAKQHGKNRIVCYWDLQTQNQAAQPL